MCARVTCRSCGKPTFSGCGRHIEQVLGDVKPADRCKCREAKAKPTAAGATDDKKPWWRPW
jgi:hypothetical protein